MLKGELLTGFEIMGSDTAARLFEKIVKENRNQSAASRQPGRMVCCIPRIAHNSAAERINLESDIVAEAASLGIGLIFSPAALEPISSNAIRYLIASGNWQTLRRNRWLHPAVLKALKKNKAANVSRNSQNDDRFGCAPLTNA